MDLGTAVGAIQIVYDGAGAQQAKADLAGLEKQGGTSQAAMLAASAGIAGLAAGAAKFTADSIGIAADVQATINSIKAASNATDAELQALDQTIGTLGKDTIFSAGEIANAADVMTKAGISVEDQVGGALETVANMAAATGEDMTTAAGVTADAMALFGLAGEDVVHVADTTTQAVNASKIGLTEYAAGFRNLGPVMAGFADDSAEANALLEDTAQVVSFFTAQGLKGADAGLSFARMIQDIATPATEEYAAAIQEAGLDMFDAEGNFIGAEKAIEQVSKAFAGLTDEEILQKLDQLGIGAEALDVAQIAANNGDEFAGFVDEMEAGNTAAESSAILMTGLEGAIESLGGSVSEVMRQMGGTLLAPVEGVVRAITGIVNAFLTLPGPVMQAVAAFIAFIAPVTALVGGIGLLMGPLAGVAGAFLALLAPILLVTAAVTALYLAFQNNLFGIQDLVNDAIGGAIDMLDTFTKKFGDAFSRSQARGLNAIAAGVRAFGLALRNATGIDITGFTDQLAQGIDAFGDSFQAAIDIGLNPFAAALTGLAAAATAVGFGDLEQQILQLAEAAQTFGNVFETSFAGGKAQGMTGLASAVQAIGDALSVVLGMDVTGPFEAIADAIDGIADAATALADVIQGALANAFDGLRNNVLPGVVSAIGNLLGTVRDVGAELLSGDFSQAGQIIGDALSSLGEWAGNVAQGLGDALATFDFAGVAQTIGDALGSALANVSAFLGSIDWGAVVSAIATTLQAALGGIGNFLTNVGALVANALMAALGTVAGFITQTDFTAVLQAVSDTLLAAFNAGGEWLGAVAATVGSQLTTAINGIGAFLGGLNFGEIVGAVGEAIGGAFTAAGEWLSGVAEIVGAALGASLATIGDFIGTIDLGGAVEAVKNAIVAAFGGAATGGGGGQHGPGASSGFASIAQAIGDALTATINTVGDFIGELDFTDIAKTVGDAISSALGTVSDFITDIDFSGVVAKIEESLATVFGGNAAGGGSFRGGAGGVEIIAQNIGLAISDAVSRAHEFVTVDLSGVLTEIESGIRDLIEVDAPFVAEAERVGEELGRMAGEAISAAISAGISSVMSGGGGDGGPIPRQAGGGSPLGDALTIGDAFAGFDKAFTAAVQAALEPQIEAAKRALIAWAETKKTDLWNGIWQALLGDPVTGEATAASDAAAEGSGAIFGGLFGGFFDGIPNNILPDPRDWVAGADAAELDKETGEAGTEIAENTGTTFADAYVAQFASQLEGADWSSVLTALDTGINTALQGAGELSSQAAKSPLTKATDTGIGATFVQGFIESITAGLTPEAFAPIKTAFDAALTAAFDAAGGGGEAAPAEGGQGSTIATSIITSIAGSLGQNVEPLKAALTAVVQAAGAGIETSGLQAVGTTIISAIAQGFGTAVGTVNSAIGAVMTAVITTANQLAAGANVVGTTLVTNIGIGMGAATGTATSAMQAVVTTIIDGGVAAAAAASAVGDAFIQAVSTALGAGATALNSGVTAMVQAGVATGVAAANASAPAIGRAISEGAASGVILTALNSAVATMVSNGIAAGMEAAEASSPSQVARRDLGMPIAEGAELGVEDGTPAFEESVGSMIDQGMQAGEDALAMARELFEQYGLTFGNDLTGSMGASIEGGMPAVADKLRGAADQLRTSIMDRVAKMHESFLPQAESVIAERNPMAAALMKDQEITFNFEATLDGEKMSEWTVRESLGGMLGVKDRGGMKRGMSERLRQ